MTEPPLADDPTLVAVVGLTTHGPAHPDPGLMQVLVRFDPSVDAGVVFLRLTAVVVELDRELRAERDAS